MGNEITLVLGVDAKYLPQLAVAIKTWAAFQPGLMRWPWVVFFDTAVHSADVAKVLGSGGKFADALLVPWGNCPNDYSSQRERMLTGFVHVPPATVETKWWMKLDCDALALPGTAREPFPDPDWFAPGAHVRVAGETVDQPTNREPVLIGSPWGYTKPADQIAKLNLWGDHHNELSQYPRLDLRHEENARRLYHPRYCSWLSFYNTEWSRWAAALSDRGRVPLKIPVPSQDGYHWYCAARTRAAVRLVKMKRYGWNNYPKFDKLQQAAQEALTRA